MSEANHPNIHAVGLAVDIINAIQKRRRGKYAKLPLSGKVFDAIPGFVALIEQRIDAQVHSHIDDEFLEENNEPKT